MWNRYNLSYRKSPTTVVRSWKTAIWNIEITCLRKFEWNNSAMSHHNVYMYLFHKSSLHTLKISFCILFKSTKRQNTWVSRSLNNSSQFKELTSTEFVQCGHDPSFEEFLITSTESSVGIKLQVVWMSMKITKNKFQALNEFILKFFSLCLLVITFKYFLNKLSNVAN